MKIITLRLLPTIASLFLFTSAAADEAPDGPVLTALLHAFLAGASQNDAAVHDRFWSEGLIYTSSAGSRFGKADIMDGLESNDEEPAAVYSAEDIQVQQFDDTAVVAFRLVSTPLAADGTSAGYFNTGTFVKEQGRWQAVAWQATKIPEN
jgi:hypothetical protein